MARDGFKINKRGLDKFQRELQKEVAKRPVQIPVEADGPESLPGAPAGHVTHNNGPVIYNYGDRVQMAWGNDTVTQNHNERHDVAPGFEDLARTVTSILDKLPDVELSDQERQETDQAAREVLAEITQTEPEPGKVRRAVTMLRGCLTPLLVGGTQAAAQQWVQQLTTAF